MQIIFAYYYIIYYICNAIKNKIIGGKQNDNPIQQ